MVTSPDGTRELLGSPGCGKHSDGSQLTQRQANRLKRWYEKKGHRRMCLMQTGDELMALIVHAREQKLEGKDLAQSQKQIQEQRKKIGHLQGKLTGTEKKIQKYCAKHNILLGYVGENIGL